MMPGLERLFELSRPAMTEIIKSFHLEMAGGLAGKGSSLKMIPTYVEMPGGDEKGRFIALDLGGTNFRVLELTLKGGRRISRPRIMKFALEKRHMNGSAELFFDFIADSVKIFLRKYKLPEASPLNLGFTFSFPIRQTGIASGILICWTKGFEARGVVGNDVVKLMNEAFVRRGIKNINISALVNDTVGTLVAKSYEDPDCDVGVIIGTGTNACYPEEMPKIKKWAGPKNKDERMIINIEWGNFNKLAATSYDHRLDGESDNPGQQILEKMVSGMYLGEIARLILKDLAARGTLSCSLIPPLLKKKGFETEYMSIIEGDRTSSLKTIGKLLGKIGLSKASLQDRCTFKRVCGIVSRRAARISASCIAAIITNMDSHLSRRHTIAIDGSVFEKHPTFSGNMKEGLKTIFGDKASRIKLVLAKDGSGKGAAIIAAVAAKR